MGLLFFIAQEVPSTDGLEGDNNLIWFIGFLIFLLLACNSFWVYRDKRVAAEVIDERKEWEKKRDAFDAWKEKTHQKMMKLALRVQSALEVWGNIENNHLVEDDED